MDQIHPTDVMVISSRKDDEYHQTEPNSARKSKTCKDCLKKERIWWLKNPLDSVVLLNRSLISKLILKFFFQICFFSLCPHKHIYDDGETVWCLWCALNPCKLCLILVPIKPVQSRSYGLQIMRHRVSECLFHASTECMEKSSQTERFHM